MDIPIRTIKKLIELLDISGISEIEVKEGDKAVRLSRNIQYPAQAPAPIQPAIYNAPTPQAAPAQTTINNTTISHADNKAAEQMTGHKVRSPMVGTYYSASSPDAAPFVTIGQTVKIGDRLCIIEAMKMFNEIEADRAGKVVSVLAQNGDPIEYDQLLFVIE